MIAALSRMAATRRGRAAGAALGLAAIALLASSPAGLAPIAARAALAAAAMFAAAALVRRRKGRPQASPALAIAGRAALSHACAVALVEADGRRFLVGIGGDGVRLVARLPSFQERGDLP